MPQLKSSGRLPPPVPVPRGRRSVPRLPSLPAPPAVKSAKSASAAPLPSPSKSTPARSKGKLPPPPPRPPRPRLRDLKTGEVLNVSEIAPTAEVRAVKAPPLTMLAAKELPMAPVRNEHYRALRALADELDAYLTEVERDKGWWREPRFVIVSEGEAVGVILQPRKKTRRR